MHVPFDFYEINEAKAWLLGFIFADSTIGYDRDVRKVRLYNRSKELLEDVRDYYWIPYKVGEQRNTNNTLYFIRFSDPNFVESIEFQGLDEDRSKLRIPQMNSRNTKAFLKGFIKGKGSFFKEQETGVQGIKIIYRSEVFIKEVAQQLSQICNVNLARPHCRMIKNCVSCQIKYVGSDYLKIKKFLGSGFNVFDN
jgi:hypothetical protein